MRKASSLTLGLISLLFLILPGAVARGAKPPLTLDDFFNSVELRSVKISPDGHAVVIETGRADWAANRFRSDLWLYRDTEGGQLIQLTQSGHDSAPEWSPDGHWIAFLSDRKAAGAEAKGRDAKDDEPSEKTVAQIYVISASGGEAFPVTFGDEEVHAFSWSQDSARIYFATRDPWTKEQKDAYKKEWNDVIRFREAERGDTIFSVDIASIAAWNSVAGGPSAKPPEPAKLASTPYRVSQMTVSPDGQQLAVATNSRSEREESREPYGIYVADLPGGALRLVIHTQDIVDEIRWAPDSRHIFFSYSHGRPEGPYEDPQTRLYWVDSAAGRAASGQTGGTATRWASRFTGSLNAFTVLEDGNVLAAARLGTEVQPYVESSADSELAKEPGWAGTYERLSAARHSARVAFVYSALQRPPEVYLADGPDRLAEAHSISAFNRLFTERELPHGKPYRWKADDGSSVEGMLLYPPGKFEARHLPTFVLIHGGPMDADGNHFEADWYQWGALAATQGWLVFEPNYRGSVGYGDAFALGIIPHIVSRPGKDIQEGVDALVKDGIADPDRLTVGGYSYGGYMTNWLIAQTQRFKAAVSGAGAAEHVANWGNDDTTFDDAYFLGGLPWEAESNYNAEAAIWQIGKVTTPTHIVAGADDIRVYVGEDYLLERALYTRGIPTSLLIFPGEGHSLDKNPWHGKIKVREELKWLEKYGNR
jgi:dipeptidyl aminopeptidase/acylaminoacyl peptidase